MKRTLSTLTRVQGIVVCAIILRMSLCDMTWIIDELTIIIS